MFEITTLDCEFAKFSRPQGISAPVQPLVPILFHDNDKPVAAAKRADRLCSIDCRNNLLQWDDSSSVPASCVS
jgi:hypothetical protein